MSADLKSAGTPNGRKDAKLKSTYIQDNKILKYATTTFDIPNQIPAAISVYGCEG
jgi:hypothetical protein